jgi:TatD DNase family protein
VFVDSHCHLNFPDLLADIEAVLANMQQQKVTHALCVSVDLETWPSLLALTDTYPQLFASVGVHPGYPEAEEPTVEALTLLAQAAKVVAIGETGLDYHYQQGELAWQRERFRTHIRVGHVTHKPLIIHTRAAVEDTLTIMREEAACEVGGVMHCFTESLSMAKAVLDMGFYISFSGIVTFKNAADLRETVRYIPLDRLLIETDSPYLAPVPFRGKTNQPAFIPYVAQCIADVRNLSIEEIAQATTANFFTLFNAARRINES